MSEIDIKNLKEGQQKITNILSEIDKISKKHNITYIADENTLLGAHKYNGWVPWENEATILILDTDYDKFKVIAKKDLPPGSYCDPDNFDIYDTTEAPDPIDFYNYGRA